MAELEVCIAGGSDREGGGRGPVVVLMHGYGAAGDDLVPLFRVLNVPSSVRFVFPVAPLEPPQFAAYGGRAWWPIDTMALQQAALEGRARERTRSVPEGMAEASQLLNEMLDCLPGELGVAPEQIILGGFSQGAMLACNVTLRTPRPLLGLALLSTTLLCQHEWQPLMAARAGLPVFQTHGLRDPLLMHELACELRDLMRAAGMNVEWMEHSGGHELPDSSLRGLGAFITRLCAPLQ